MRVKKKPKPAVATKPVAVKPVPDIAPVASPKPVVQKPAAVPAPKATPEPFVLNGASLRRSMTDRERKDGIAAMLDMTDVYGVTIRVGLSARGLQTLLMTCGSQ